MMEDLIAEYERLRRLAITRPTATFRHWSSAAGATYGASDCIMGQYVVT